MYVEHLARPGPPAARGDVARRLSVSSVIHDRPSTPRSSFWTVRLKLSSPTLDDGSTAAPGWWASAPAHHSEYKANAQAAEEMPHGEGTWPVSWIPSSSRAARPPGMRPLAATVRRRPAGGCGPAPASGIQPSGMHPQPGPGCARVRRRRPAPSLRLPRSRAGSYRWPVREPRRTGGRCPATATPGHAPVPGGRAPLRGAASYEAEG